MEKVKKGLCVTCINDKGCTFPRKFPVWQCEEFTGDEPKPTKIKKQRKSIISCADEEPKIWE